MEVEIKTKSGKHKCIVDGEYRIYRGYKICPLVAYWPFRWTINKISGHFKTIRECKSAIDAACIAPALKV